jgi:5-methyltetrahydropteroyltriglutamate--homocysteine methyltransferase
MTHAVGPPFRAEHIGSLLRPPRLKRAFRALSGGEITNEAFAGELEEAIRAAVRLQEDVGLQAVTDGEFARSSWFGFFFEGMSGFRLEPSAFRFKDEQGSTYDWPTCYACAPMHRASSITGDEYRRLARLTRRTPKLTMPAPSAFHFFRFHAPADPSIYPDPARYWDDLVAVYRAEIAELGALGCRYLQLDEVPLAMLCDPGIRAQVSDAGSDPNDLARRYVGALQRILSDVPAGMTVGIHLCRGNFRSRWMAAGGYEPVAELLFNEVPADVFLLEYDTPRAGDFAPLRLVPAGKSVVLGLVSSKTAALEDADTLRRRLEEAGRYLPLERLALSPQCGFASVAGGNVLTEADEIAKLRLVVDVAARVWN